MDSKNKNKEVIERFDELFLLEMGKDDGYSEEREALGKFLLSELNKAREGEREKERNRFARIIESINIKTSPEGYDQSVSEEIIKLSKDIIKEVKKWLLSALKTN